MTSLRYGLSFLLSSLIFFLLALIFINLLHAQNVIKVPKEHVVKISVIHPVKKIVPKTVSKPTPMVQSFLSSPIVPIAPIPKRVVHKKMVHKKVVHKKIKHKTRKPKHKRIIKKKVHKKKKVKKRKIKKYKSKKRVIKKRVIKKKKHIIKKKVIKHKKVVKKKVIRRVEPEPIYEPTFEPIIEEVYYDRTIAPVVQPQPRVVQRYETPIYETPIYETPRYVAPRAVQRTVPQPVSRPRVVTPPRPRVVPQQVDNGAGKRAFLRNVRNQIISNKRYPRMALRRHIEGSVRVKFNITANGSVSNIRFISGKSIFYKEVKKTLRRTFPVGIPANMRNKLPIPDVSVTIHFNIN